MNTVAKTSLRFFDGRALGILSGSIDRYKGVTLTNDLQQEFTCAKQWDTTLDKSITHFKEQGLRAIWLKVAKANLDLAHVATGTHNFEIHHAKPDYLMLTKWLDDSSESRLPGFATHYIGVGGLVLNKDKTKLLCI